MHLFKYLVGSHCEEETDVIRNTFGNLIAEAKQNQDYFAFERIVEIFKTTSGKFDEDNTKFYLPMILTEGYLYFGQNDKAIEAYDDWMDDAEWELDFGVRYYSNNAKASFKLVLKLNKLAKMREEATRVFQSFRDILMESSSEIHKKLAFSFPIMDTIQRNIDPFIEELENEIASFMFTRFLNKQDTFMYFTYFATGTGLTELDGSQYEIFWSGQKAFESNQVYDIGMEFLRGHSEFQQVYQKYKKEHEDDIQKFEDRSPVLQCTFEDPRYPFRGLQLG